MIARKAISQLGFAAVLITALALQSTSVQAQLAGTPDSDDRAASKWKPWVLSSGSEMRLPPPPDETATRLEIQRLRAMIASRDPALRDRIS